MMALLVLKIDRSIGPMAVSLKPAPPADLPPSVSADGTRLRLLRAGLEGLFEKGLHGTSIRDIALRAGVQSATLYGHFASKEELLAELIILGHTVHHQRLAESLMDVGTDPCDQLRSLVTAHVAIHAEYPMLASVSTSELPRLTPTAAAPAYALRARSLALLDGIVDRGVDQGLFAVPHREMTLQIIGSMGTNVASWFARTTDHPDIPEVAAGLADVAIRMVTAG
jgi:AcrR family transcriptional regulator